MDRRADDVAGNRASDWLYGQLPRGARDRNGKHSRNRTPRDVCATADLGKPCLVGAGQSDGRDSPEASSLSDLDARRVQARGSQLQERIGSTPVAGGLLAGTGWFVSGVEGSVGPESGTQRVHRRRGPGAGCVSVFSRNRRAAETNLWSDRNQWHFLYSSRR